MDKYIKDVTTTENTDFEGMGDRVNPHLLRLLHSAIGLSTESGEYLDMLKKHIFYGADIDYVNIEEEIGDILYYIALTLDELGVSLESIMKKNIDKLSARYPDKFTKEKALNRDLDTEREILKGVSKE